MEHGLIVSLEGLPGSGKSTLQRRLGEAHNYVLIPPVWDFGGGLEKYADVPRTREEIRKRERDVLSMTVSMMEAAREVRERGGVAVLHQSHTSSLAYTHAFSKFSGIDTFRECSEDYISSVYQSMILPDLYVFLAISFEESLRRQSSRGRFVNQIWSEKIFVEDYMRFYRTYVTDVERIPSISVDGQQNPSDVISQTGAEIARVVDSRKSSGAESERFLSPEVIRPRLSGFLKELLPAT